MELFLFGTFWFWVLTVAALVIITAFEECDQGIGATICLIAYIVILQWLGGNDILGYILHHPIHIVVGLVTYFLIGTIWGVGKWAIYVKSRSQDLVEAFRDWCESKKIPWVKPMSTETWEDFEHAVYGRDKDGKDLESYRYSSSSNPYKKYQDYLTAPRIRDHKDRFIRWLAFWPVSMLYTLFNDMVRNICRQIYLALATRLQAISDGIYKRAIPK